MALDFTMIVTVSALAFGETRSSHSQWDLAMPGIGIQVFTVELFTIPMDVLIIKKQSCGDE